MINIQGHMYKNMDEMTTEDEHTLSKVVSLVEWKFNVRFTANDLSVKRVECKKCGGDAFCIHFHSRVPGHRHPELMVDVDDIFEICTCGFGSRMYDEVYETNNTLRIKKCPFCGRDIFDGDLRLYNRSSC